MSSAEPTDGHAPSSPPAKAGLWERVKRALVGSDTEFLFFRNLTFLGCLSTVLVGVFQYVSAYHDKVADLAKVDFNAATSALTETVNALSGPLSLQDRLIWYYSSAMKNKTENEDDAYETESARATYKSYDDSFTTLNAGIKLFARKMEIYLDLPGDLNHAAANNSLAKYTPISASILRESDFNCETDMPVFGDAYMKKLTPKDDSNDSSNNPAINWRSVRDNLLTLQYCFEFTDQAMAGIRHWASKSTADKSRSKAIDVDIGKLKNLSKRQSQRFNDFMSVATFKIEQFRVTYQPNGFLCAVLGVDTALDHFAHVCTPRLIADQ
ncbi:MAG TPA: hypothetical protein VK337_09285 [Xanthobacteraceae bacterium]|nr:hypothetical protein [Xanthobacteraceae bacterium]